MPSDIDKRPKMDYENILTVPFASFFTRGRKKRKLFLSKLIGGIIKHKMICVVIVNKLIVIFEPTDISRLLRGKHISTRIYAITEIDEIETGARLLLRSKPWYRLGFTMLVGDNKMLPELIEKKSWIEWDNIPLLATQIRSDLMGYTFPIDDELEFYGKNPFKNIVLKSIQEMKSEK